MGSDPIQAEFPAIDVCAAHSGKPIVDVVGKFEEVFRKCARAISPPRCAGDPYIRASLGMHACICVGVHACLPTC